MDKYVKSNVSDRQNRFITENSEMGISKSVVASLLPLAATQDFGEACQKLAHISGNNSSMGNASSEQGPYHANVIPTQSKFKQNNMVVSSASAHSSSLNIDNSNDYMPPPQQMSVSPSNGLIQSVKHSGVYVGHPEQVNQVSAPSIIHPIHEEKLEEDGDDEASE